MEQGNNGRSQPKGFLVFELPGAKANKSDFESYLNKQNIRFVMFNGHGAPDLITGYKKEVILQAGKNDNLLKGKVAYARSCYSLSILGESCVTAGADGFVGSELPFMFVSDPTRGAHPLKDELAKLPDPGKLLAEKADLLAKARQNNQHTKFFLHIGR